MMMLGSLGGKRRRREVQKHKVAKTIRAKKSRVWLNVAHDKVDI